jgi:hypothetical protein
LLVIDKTQPAPKPGTGGAVETPGGAGGTGPWYGKLWSSIRAADQGAR